MSNKMPLNAGPKKYPDQWSSHTIVFTPKGTRIETSGPNEPVGGRALLVIASGCGFKGRPKIQRALIAFLSVVDNEHEMKSDRVVRTRGSKQSVVTTISSGRLAHAEAKAAHEKCSVEDYLSELLEAALKAEESKDEFFDLHPGTIRSTPEEE